MILSKNEITLGDISGSSFSQKHFLQQSVI